jgi:hypothetical protein
MYMQYISAAQKIPYLVLSLMPHDFSMLAVFKLLISLQDAAAEFKYQLHMAINDPSLPRPPIPYSRPRLPSVASSVTPNVSDIYHV